MLAVKVAGCDGMADGDGVVLKVNRAPFQSKGFASPQAVESTQEDRNLKARPFRCSKELFYLVAVVEAADKPILFRALHLIRRICRDQINLHSVFQRLMDIRVIVNDGIGGNG